MKNIFKNQAITSIIIIIICTHEQILPHTGCLVTNNLEYICRVGEGERERGWDYIYFFLKSLFNMEPFSLFNGKGELSVEFLVRFIRG